MQAIRLPSNTNLLQQFTGVLIQPYINSLRTNDITVEIFQKRFSNTISATKIPVWKLLLKLVPTGAIC